MLDIGAPEFLLLVVLAIVMFGPERIPEMARKAAKIVYFLRNIANDATTQLKAELGPEYADLTPADLNPKTFISKHLLNDIQGELDEIKTDLADIKDELNEDAAALGSTMNETLSEVEGELHAPVDQPLSLGVSNVESAPFDTEAT